MAHKTFFGGRLDILWQIGHFSVAHRMFFADGLFLTSGSCDQIIVWQPKNVLCATEKHPICHRKMYYLPKKNCVPRLSIKPWWVITMTQTMTQGFEPSHFSSFQRIGTLWSEIGHLIFSVLYHIKFSNQSCKITLWRTRAYFGWSVVSGTQISSHVVFLTYLSTN